MTSRPFNALNLLNFAGRNGPLLLCIALIAGLAWPALASAARPWMAPAVFAVNLGLFLQVDRAGLTTQFSCPGRLLVVLAWTLIGVPLLTWLLLQALPLPAPLKTGVLLYAMAPPAASAAALAAVLGMNASLALLSRVAACLMAPLLLPLLSGVLIGDGQQVDPLAMARELAVVVLGAASAAALLRRLGGARLQGVQTSTGVSVIGLVVVGVGTMEGMQAQWLRDSGALSTALVAAFAATMLLQLVGTLAFARLPRADALAVGLVSGYRNVTLVWVALVPQPDPASPLTAFFAMSMVTCFTAPFLIERALRGFGTRSPARAAATELPQRWPVQPAPLPARSTDAPRTPSTQVLSPVADSATFQPKRKPR